MNLSVGIVGLPNVGKSTLFNALLKKQQAYVANYPFATIEPNVGIVPVPDQRLEKLADITANEILKPSNSAGRQVQDDKSKRPPIVPATVKFVDIAGLVKGAAEGAGLGNKFLSHVREVSIIAHVIRAFDDPSTSSGQVPIIREGSVDPKSDYETINTELLLADLQTIQNSKAQLKTQNQVGLGQNSLDKILAELNKGIAIRDIALTVEEKQALKDLHLLTAKPEIVVLNVSESEYTQKDIESIFSRLYSRTVYGTKNMIVICAKIEAELAQLSQEEQKEYLKDLGLNQSGLERLIQKAYEALGLISFLTAPTEKPSSAKASEGQWEVRAWTIKKGTNAIEAAGEIHTDFMKKFIKAEVVSYKDFIENSGWKGTREKGRARMEGRDYIMKDGDVVEFRIGS